jgi:hypothetical protein
VLDAMTAGRANERDPFEEILGKHAPPAPSRQEPLAVPLEGKPMLAAEVRPDAAAPESGSDEGPRRARRDIDLSPEQLATIKSRRLAYERSALEAPVASAQINTELAHAIRMFTASEGGNVLLRYFFERESGKDRLARRLRAYVSRGGQSLISAPLDAKRVFEMAADWNPEAGPSIDLAEALYDTLLRPLAKLLGPLSASTRLVIIPSDELLGLPLHVASGPETNGLPLCAVVPLCFSVSAAAYVDRGRHLLARFFVEESDDLCAFMEVDEAATGSEIVGLDWAPELLHLCGKVPEGLDPGAYTPILATGLEALDRLAELRPELFLHSGHGSFDEDNAGLGPLLSFGDLHLSQFDVAQKVRLPRNKLTLLGACVTGRGAQADDGEVAGFLRAFMAAGSGAIGLTLWNVLDETIGRTLRDLLGQTANARREKRLFDVVEELRSICARACATFESPGKRIEACPLALYL